MSGFFVNVNAAIAAAKTVIYAAFSAPSGASIVGGGKQVTPSIASLRTLLKTSASKNAFVTGYYAAGDGGGGAYYLDEADSASIDNGGSVIVATDGGRWKIAQAQNIHARQFGASPAASAAVNRAAIQKALDFCKIGKTLDLGPGEYDLGTTTPGVFPLIIDSPVGMKIIGNNALLKCVGTNGRCVAIAVKNPNGFESNGVNFTNPGFVIANTVGGGELRIGIYGYLLYATAPYTAQAPCGNVKINGTARDCMGLVIIDAANQMGVAGVAFAMKDVTVTGTGERIYYGVSNVYGATDVAVKLICKDVRRGFVSYAQKRAKIDIALDCTAGFIGSNGFVELAAEGSIYGDVSDVDIRVSVSGVEAHEGIVHLYHQSPEATGSIANIKARVTCNALTTAGKAAGLGAFDIFKQSHESGGSVLANTSRASANLDLDCDINGSITGATLRVLSLPAIKHPVSLGAGITRAQTNFGLWNVFRVMRGTVSLLFTPSVSGRTANGSASYATQKGWFTVVDGVASYGITLSWTGHTGAGNMFVAPLPLASVTSTNIGNPLPAILAGGFGAAGVQIGALLTGQGDEFTIYTIDNTTHGIGTQPVAAAGTLFLSGTFPIY